MKQIIPLVFTSLLCMLTACQQIEPSKESPGPTKVTEIRADSSSEAPEEDLYTFDFGVKSRFTPPFYPCGAYDVYSPTFFLSENRTCFPDTVNSFLGLEDTIGDSDIHIGSLNCDLEIPDGYYVYSMPGQYWDWSTNQAVTLEFVREYVFTMKSVSEDKLLEDIRTYFNSKNSFNYNDLSYRGPGYVVYSFRVFRQEYLPIENLFSPLLADTGEYFSSGNYFCSLGRSAWSNGNNLHYFGPIEDPMSIDPFWQEKSADELLAEGFYLSSEDFPLSKWVQTLIINTVPPVFSTESTTDRSSIPVWDKSGSFFYGADSMFKTGSAAYWTRPNDRYISNALHTSNLAASVVSDTWWDDYLHAKSILKEELYGDHYLGKIDLSFRNGLFSDQDRELMNDWYYDPEKTNELQAYIYANLSAFRYIDLNSIVILARDIEDGSRLYVALVDEHPEDETPHELTLVEWSWDALGMIDLSFAREYAVKWFSSEVLPSAP